MFTLDDLRLSDDELRASLQRPRRHALPWRQRDMFIRPLPWSWVSAAVQLPGAALRVALLLAWQAGVQRRSKDLTIPTTALQTFRVTRHAYYRALRELETARLITVTHQPGQKARVTIVGDLTLSRKPL
jgi:hypothetical protein